MIVRNKSEGKPPVLAVFVRNLTLRRWLPASGPVLIVHFYVDAAGTPIRTFIITQAQNITAKLNIESK